MARLHTKAQAVTPSKRKPEQETTPQRRSRRLSDQALAEADTSEVIDISESSPELVNDKEPENDNNSSSEEEDDDDDAPEEEGFSTLKQNANKQETARQQAVQAQQARDKAARRKKSQALADQSSKRKKPAESVVVVEDDGEEDEDQENEDEGLLSADLLQKFQQHTQQNKRIRLDTEDNDDADTATPKSGAAAGLQKKKKKQGPLTIKKGPVQVQVLDDTRTPRRSLRQQNKVMMPPKAEALNIVDEWLGRKTIDRRSKVVQHVNRR